MIKLKNIPFINKYASNYRLIYFVFLAIILLINNGNVSLWDQDEAAYAGFAKTMLDSNNWLIPDFMWSDIHRKTPLHFWNIAISYVIFGVNEFAVRFPSAVFLFSTYFIIYKLGKQIFDQKTSFIGTVVLSTTLFVPSLAKVSVTDATILFFSTLCAFAMIKVIMQRSLYWVVIFWISFSLALLTKGPPIIVFTGSLVFILLIFHPNRKNLVSFHPWIFLPLSFVPLLAWGYFVYQKDNGVFINWLIDWYILKRINGSVLGQTGPPGMHLLSILVFFIPYLMFFPIAIWNAVSGILKKEKNENFFLSAWFISGWLLYEFSPSKLPAYVIAAHVPLAILIGKEIKTRFEEKRLPNQVLFFIHCSMSLIISCALIFIPFQLELIGSLKLVFITSGIIMILFLITVLYSMKTIKVYKAVIIYNIVFQILIWGVLIPRIDGLKNGSKRVAEFILIEAKKDSKIFIANTQGHPPSLPFYLGMNFSDVKEETNLDSLLAKYNSNFPSVLILNFDQLVEMKSKVESLNYHKVKSMLTDRKEDASYYIVMNKWK